MTKNVVLKMPIDVDGIQSKYLTSIDGYQSLSETARDDINTALTDAGINDIFNLDDISYNMDDGIYAIFSLANEELDEDAIKSATDLLIDNLKGELVDNAPEKPEVLELTVADDIELESFDNKLKFSRGDKIKLARNESDDVYVITKLEGGKTFVGCISEANVLRDLLMHVAKESKSNKNTRLKISDLKAKYKLNNENILALHKKRKISQIVGESVVISSKVLMKESIVDLKEQLTRLERVRLVESVKNNVVYFTKLNVVESKGHLPLMIRLEDEDEEIEIQDDNAEVNNTETPEEVNGEVNEVKTDSLPADTSIDVTINTGDESETLTISGADEDDSNEGDEDTYKDQDDNEVVIDCDMSRRESKNKKLRKNLRKESSSELEELLQEIKSIGYEDAFIEGNEIIVDGDLSSKVGKAMQEELYDLELEYKKDFVFDYEAADRNHFEVYISKKTKSKVESIKNKRKAVVESEDDAKINVAGIKFANKDELESFAQNNSINLDDFDVIFNLNDDTLSLQDKKEPELIEVDEVLTSDDDKGIDEADPKKEESVRRKSKKIRTEDYDYGKLKSLYDDLALYYNIAKRFDDDTYEKMWDIANKKISDESVSNALDLTFGNPNVENPTDLGDALSKFNVDIKDFSLGVVLLGRVVNDIYKNESIKRTPKKVRRTERKQIKINDELLSKIKEIGFEDAYIDGDEIYVGEVSKRDQDMIDALEDLVGFNNVDIMSGDSRSNIFEVYVTSESIKPEKARRRTERKQIKINDELLSKIKEIGFEDAYIDGDEIYVGEVSKRDQDMIDALEDLVGSDNVDVMSGDSRSNTFEVYVTTESLSKKFAKKQLNENIELKNTLKEIVAKSKIK